MVRSSYPTKEEMGKITEEYCSLYSRADMRNRQELKSEYIGIIVADAIPDVEEIRVQVNTSVKSRQEVHQE